MPKSTCASTSLQTRITAYYTSNTRRQTTNKRLGVEFQESSADDVTIHFTSTANARWNNSQPELGNYTRRENSKGTVWYLVHCYSLRRRLSNDDICEYAKIGLRAIRETITNPNARYILHYGKKYPRVFKTVADDWVEEVQNAVVPKC